MRIALDATYSVGEGLTGVGVYSREILYGLAAAHPEAEFLFCYRPHRLRRSFAERLPLNAARRVLLDRFPSRAALFHALNQRTGQRTRGRTVSTFHDLFVLTAEYSTPEFRARFSAQARAAAENSDLIIAVSDFTARQVEELLGVERSRLRVVHHGVHPPSTDPPEDSDRENLILNVGAIQKRKNISRLLTAFERAAPPDWRLVLAGSIGFGGDEILKEIEASPRRADIDVLGYVEEIELRRLYNRARVFAFPSLDEGFGMPVLDAMANGVPVLTSNRSALPEIAADAALLVDPRSTDELSSALQRLTQNRQLRTELRRRGAARAHEFSWAKAVTQTWSIYQELLR